MAKHADHRKHRRFILIPDHESGLEMLSDFVQVAEATKTRIPGLILQVEPATIRAILRDHPDAVIIFPLKIQSRAWSSAAKMCADIKAEFPESVLILFAKLTNAQLVSSIKCDGIIRDNGLGHRKLAYFIRETQPDWTIKRMFAEFRFIIVPRT